MEAANVRAAVTRNRCVLLIALLLACITESAAAPMITATSSTLQARKGEPFKIYLHINAQESLKGFDISVTSPTGFEVQAETKAPNALENGSSYTVVYSVKPPSTTERKGGDTRERKVFVFNVAYTSQADGQTRQLFQSVDLSLGFAIAPYMYLFCGILGAALGSMIKTLTQRTLERTPWKTIKSVFRDGIGAILTSVAVAFVVLLVLSRDTIPTKGWYDSVALGVAVAILSDEQLLMKVKQVLPKGTV